MSKKANDIPKSFSNDATSKLLGYEYQKLIALEYCLNAKPNEHIWIECKGDVADRNTSVEVKHHVDGGAITSNSVDAWKTIRNYIREYPTLEQYSQLVLHTTAVANSNSIFYGWNQLSKEEKKKKLIYHAPVDSIANYHKEVVACKVEKLLSILSKFRILEGQVSIKDKWVELLIHPALIMVRNEFRDHALEKLYGYITARAIEHQNEWKINVNDFRRDMQSTLAPFTKDKIPFPITSADEVVQNDTKEEYVFVQKMRQVSLPLKREVDAVLEYLRTEISLHKLLRDTPTIKENLELYDENVAQLLSDQKAEKCIGFLETDLNTEKALNTSQKLYFHCINMPHEQIISVTDTQRYFRNGRIYHTLEVSDFQWKICKHDL